MRYLYKIFKNRISSVLLSTVLLIGLITPINALAGTSISSASAISLETNVTCSITSENSSQYYSFTPTQSGYYVFTSWSKDLDPLAEIFNSSGNYLGSDDDSGEGSNFKLVYYLNSGSKYYFSAGFYSNGTGSYKIRLSRYDENAPTVTATTSSDAASTQSIKLTASDDNGIAYIYYGSSEDVLDNTQYSYSNKTSLSANCSVKRAVTYYIDVFDGSCNRTTYSFSYCDVNLYQGYGEYSTILVPCETSVTLPSPSDVDNYTFFGWLDSDNYENYEGLSSVRLVHEIDGEDCYSSYYGIWGIGKRYTASVSSYSSHNYYYTPSESGVYEICSLSTDDTVGKLYDENGKLLCSDDDGGFDSNYCMIRYLSAGKKYSINSKYYKSENSGSFYVGINKITCNHSDYTEKTVKASVSENGKITKTCDVCGKVISTKTIPAIDDIYLSKYYYTYSGKATKPTVSIWDTNGNKVSSSNYTVTYKNNKNIGTARVIINYKNKYKGNTTVYYDIYPKSISITNKQLEFLSNSNKIKVILQRVSNITGYQVQFGEDKNFKKKKTKTVKASTKSVTQKIKTNKTYYIRARTYKTVNGIKYYSDWSKTRKISVY